MPDAHQGGDVGVQVAATAYSAPEAPAGMARGERPRAAPESAPQGSAQGREAPVPTVPALDRRPDDRCERRTVEVQPTHESCHALNAVSRIAWTQSCAGGIPPGVFWGERDHPRRTP